MMAGADPLVDLLVTEATAGGRLDVAVAALLGESRSRTAQRIDAGQVSIDGAAARRSHVLVAGQRVVVADPGALPAVTPPPSPPVRYRDEHLVVVAKPAGLVVHPGTGHRGDTLVDALHGAGVPLAAGEDATRPGVVHRLDRDTSGLMVLASSAPAHEALVAALRDRTVTRRYLALLAAPPPESRGVVDAPIARHPDRRTVFAIVAGGRPARTRFRVLATAPIVVEDGAPRTVALVVCGLETGRTHQIRVHLDAVGAPVAGDPVYGTDRAMARALGLERPFLHAAHLSFAHPVTGAPLAFTEPLPPDLAGVLSRLGLAAPQGDEEP